MTMGSRSHKGSGDFTLRYGSSEDVDTMWRKRKLAVFRLFDFSDRDDREK